MVDLNNNIQVQLGRAPWPSWRGRSGCRSRCQTTGARGACRPRCWPARASSTGALPWAPGARIAGRGWDEGSGSFHPLTRSQQQHRSEGWRSRLHARTHPAQPTASPYCRASRAVSRVPATSDSVRSTTVGLLMHAAPNPAPWMAGDAGPGLWQRALHHCGAGCACNACIHARLNCSCSQSRPPGRLHCFVQSLLRAPLPPRCAPPCTPPSSACTPLSFVQVLVQDPRTDSPDALLVQRHARERIQVLIRVHHAQLPAHDPKSPTSSGALGACEWEAANVLRLAPGPSQVRQLRTAPRWWWERAPPSDQMLCAVVWRLLAEPLGRTHAMSTASSTSGRSLSGWCTCEGCTSPCASRRL